MQVADVLCKLDEWFPLALAESWDNVGLLLGDPARNVQRVMTCLTVTRESAAEAIREQVDLIVAHHPIFFRPIQRLTACGSAGYLYDLARNGTGVYSPHTSYDGATGGINEQIALRLGLKSIDPLRPTDDPSPVGAGRWGRFVEPMPLHALAQSVKLAFGNRSIEVVGDAGRACSSVAIACGAGGEFLGDASRLGCDVLITGEMRFHQYLEALERGVALLLPGHYSTERFALEALADRLRQAYPDLQIWASRAEKDPVWSV